MNESLLAKDVGNMKFGGIALKNFSDMQVSSLVLSNTEDVRNSVEVNLVDGTLSVQQLPVQGKDKNPIKNIEKTLKALGIPLAGYGKIHLNAENSDDTMQNYYYPLLMAGKYPVREPKFNQPV